MRAALFTLILWGGIGSAEEKWMRFTTPHFEVFSDAGVDKGREALRRFDQIRQAMGKLLTVKPKAGPPLRIFVFGTDRELDGYKDARRKALAAFYQPGRDRDYIAMQNTGADMYRIVFHEYTHVVIKHAGIPVPLWFNEGMAELFSTVEISGSQIKLGVLIPAHILTLREQKLVDLPTLMGVDQDSPLYNEQSKVSIFYAESWAFVHMLNMNQEYAPARKKFLELVLGHVALEQALQQAFQKTSEQVVSDLREYVNGNGFMAGILKSERVESIERIEPEAISPTDAGIALAELQINVGKVQDADRRLKMLAAGNPNVAAIEAEMGDVALAQRNEKDALAHYRKAIELGSKNARVYFEKANLIRDRDGERESTIQQIAPDLEKAIEMDPNYWQARHLLGYLYFREGHYREAVEQLTAASNLESRNVNIWETLALAQYYAGHSEEAGRAARQGRVLAANAQEISRLDGTIHKIETREDARPPIEGAEEAGPNWKNPKGDRRIEGKLVRLDCSSAGARFHILAGAEEVVLRVDDPRKVVLTNAPGQSVELNCGPFTARRVAVEYVAKPDGQGKTAGEMTALEFK